jgi:predicted metal-dependent enzyme (double-stranded beta helix superfamily)
MFTAPRSSPTPRFNNPRFAINRKIAMSYQLDQFARDVHNVLAADPGPAGRERVRQLLQKVLVDEVFIATHLGDDQPQRRVLYEDPELGFLILGHVFHEAKRTKPHDHGPSWAIYGQAAGESIMDHWEIVEPARREAPGKVRLVESYHLTPGVAYVYNEGALHAPRREAPAKLVRIEGQHIDTASRFEYIPV